MPLPIPSAEGGGLATWRGRSRDLVAAVVLAAACSAAAAVPAAAQTFTIGQNASLEIGVSSFTAREARAAVDGLNEPLGAAFDSSGNLWVADASNNRVLQFAPPFVDGMGAVRVLGQPDFISSAPATTQVGMSSPTAVAFDASGNLWVTDRNNARVLQFKPPFFNGMRAPLVLGQPDFVSKTAVATQSGMALPAAAAFDSSGNLWVSDAGINRVLKFSPPFSNGMNAALVLGQPDFTSILQATTQSGMYFPGALAFDSGGNLWVVDLLNNRVLEFAPPFANGMNAALVLGQATFVSNAPATSQGGLSGPLGLAFDGVGNLWVADYFNNRALRFTPPFATGMNASVVLGQPLFTTNATAVGQGGFFQPVGVLFDGSGDLWVTDSRNHRVLEFAAPFSNGMNAAFVLGQSKWNAGPGAPTRFSLSAAGAAYDSSGNLWVADQNNHRVLRFDPPFADGLGASLVLGQAGFTSNAAATTQGGLNFAAGVSVDPTGNLWVADSSNHRVLRFSPPFSNGMNASLVLGQPGYATAVAAVAQNAMDGPAGVYADAFGSVWVADSSNHRVLRFDPPFTDGMNASLVLGQPNFASKVLAAAQDRLDFPTDMSIDGSGNLWVADLGNNRAVRFNPPFANGMNASVVLGQANFTSNLAAATQTGLSSPVDLAIDAAGDLWVVDGLNNRALLFVAPFISGMGAAKVLGQPDFTTAAPGGGRRGLNFPNGIAIDGSGGLWVSDANNARLVKFVAGGDLALTARAAGTGAGTVASTPAGINCGPTCSAGFAPATVVTLTATPAAGTVFAGWSGGGCSGTGNCVVTLNAATAVTASFNRIPLAVAKAGGGSGTVTSDVGGINCGSTCAGDFMVGEQVTLTAAAAPGSVFAGWSGAGCSGTGTCVVTVSAAVTVTAAFDVMPTFAIGQNASLELGVTTFTANGAGAGAGGLKNPLGAAFDFAGNLWVADGNNNRVLRFSPPFSSGMNASLVLGQPNFVSVASQTTQSGMNRPRQIAFDVAGNVWVADQGNSRLLKFIPPFSNGMNAALVLGQLSFTSSATVPVPTNQRLNNPTALVFNGADLWVADSGNNRVLKFTDPTATGDPASLVLGQADFTSKVAAATQSGLFDPEGVAFDAGGNLWVADDSNNRVLQFVPPFTSGMNASLVLGQANFTSNAAATTQGGLHFPRDVALDASGNLWVGEEANNRVLRFSPPFSNGMNASIVLGKPDFTSTAAPSLASGLGVAVDLSFDASGNLWVTDFSNNRVVRFQPPFSNGMSLSLVVGQTIWSEGSTLDPYGMAFDSSGNLWVADGNKNRVLRFSPPFADGKDPSLVLGQPDFTSMLAATTQSGMSHPMGVAFDGSGSLWVADELNSRILRFAPPFSNGMNASLVIGQTVFTSGGGGLTQSRLLRPREIAFDASGNLWVADTYNERVLEFQPPFSDGMNASLVLGQPNFTTAAAATTQGGMNSPEGLSFDASGNLWVSDKYNSRILRFVPPFSTGMNASLVLGQANFTTAAAAVTQTGLQSPLRTAFDAQGNLWVVDNNNFRLLEFVPPFSNGMNASLVLGQGNFTSKIQSSAQNGFNFPEGVAIDSGGNVWVSDELNDRIVQFRPGAVTVTLIVNLAGTGAGTVTSSPAGINCGSTCSTAFDRNTQVTLTAVAASGSTFEGWSGGGCSGTGSCAVTLAAATTVTATFSRPTLTVIKAGAGVGTVTSGPAGIACGANCAAGFDSGTPVTLTAVAGVNSAFAGWSGGGCSGTGTCVVTMTAATTVSAIFDAAPAFTIGQNASLVLGVSSFTAKEFATAANRFYDSAGNAFDSAGNLWVADYLNNRVLRFTPPFFSGMSASLVLGQTDFTSSGLGATTQSKFKRPRMVAIDASGNVWVTDQGNSRVLRFSPPFSNGMNASLVLGQFNFTNNFQGTAQDAMNGPLGMCFDPSGNLWVTEDGNHRVLRFAPPFISGMSASSVLGQPNFTSNAAATTQSGLRNPGGVACDAGGNVWVADGLNRRVLQFVAPFSDGMNAALVLGQADFTSAAQATTQSGFRFGGYVSFDSSGNLWVDDGNRRVLQFRPPFSSGMNASLVIGQADFVSDSSATTRGRFATAGPPSFDASGNLWVTDEFNHRVLEFKPPFSNGMDASLVLGHGVWEVGSTNDPYGVAFDPSGNLWVADGSKNRVLRFDPPFTDGKEPSLVLGQPNFTFSAAATTQDGMYSPHAVAFDSSGNLWVADEQNSRVLRFVPPFTNGMNASLVLGQANFVSNDFTNVTQASMRAPNALAFDASGNLWVADTYNYRLLKFVPPFSTGMNASLVLGQADFTSRVGATTQSGMWEPMGTAFDASGNLWVADNYRVRKFVPPFSTGMNASLVLGQANFTSGVSATSQNGLYGNLAGIAFDSGGSLWVVDTGNRRVLEFRPPFSSGMNASMALGQPNFTSGATSGAQNGLAWPKGIAIDAGGNLWVAEPRNSGNARVVQFRPGLPDVSLIVNRAGTGAGTVTSAPAGINCGSTCSAGFAPGAQVTLSATPGSGSVFSGWSGGGCSGTGNCVVTLAAAAAVTATFNVAANVLLTVAKAGTGSGTVTSDAGGISCGAACSANLNGGDVVTLTAAPAAGSFFSGWSGGGCSGRGACAVTMDGTKLVTAAFYLVPSFAIGQSASLELGVTTFTAFGASAGRGGLSAPAGGAFDASGNLWVADFANNRVLQFMPPFSVGMSASQVLGQSAFSSSAPATARNGFRGPAALAFDASGNLWVSDVDNNRVLRFAPPFYSGMRASLVIGQPGFLSSAAATTQVGLSSPTGVAFDASGGLWVSDGSNNRVLRFVPPFSSGMAAALVLGRPDFVSNAAAAGQSGLNSPEGLSFDSGGNLWVADGGNNRVLEFSPPFASGMNAVKVLGQGNFTSNAPALTQGGLAGPAGVAFDSAGSLWVTDLANHRILRFAAPFSDGMSASSVLGQADFTSGAPATTQGGMINPRGLAFDASGGLWAGDFVNNRMLRFAPPFANGMGASLVLGQTVWSSGSGAPSQRSVRPSAQAFDADGNLWAADFSNHRVLMFEPPFSDGKAASKVLGQGDFVSGAPATTQGGMRYPSGLAFDSGGGLWVSDTWNSRVLKFVPPFTNGMNATLALGQADFTTSLAATAQNRLAFPYRIAFDAAGGLWVADASNNRVLKFAPPFSSGMSASLVLGQPNFTSNAPAVTPAGMGAPLGLAFDAGGNLWVSNQGQHRVLRFAPPFSNGMNAALVLGQGDFTSSAAAAAQNALNSPFSVAVDPVGNLWVSDTANNRVLEFAPPFSSGMGASLVLGQGDFTSKAPAVGQGGLDYPVDAAFDAAGRPWVADFNSRRVLGYLGGGPVTLSIDVGGSGAGRVTGSLGGIDCGLACSANLTPGAQVTLTATPAAGSVFSGWGGVGCMGLGNCSVTMSGAKSVAAVFTRLHTLTVTKTGTGTGAVTSNPSGLVCDPTCSAGFEHGALVTLLPTAGPGAVFLGWSGAGCSGTGPCVVVMEEAASVTAEFKLVQYVRGYLKDGAGAAIAGATVTVVGASSATRVTGPDGAYDFPTLARGGDFTVTPYKAGVEFAPRYRVYPQLMTSRDQQNFNSDIGYAIIVRGGATVPCDPSVDAGCALHHLWSTDATHRVYEAFLRRGFAPGRITYFNSDDTDAAYPKQFPAKSAVLAAIQGLKTQVQNGVPLYIVLDGHGGPGGSFLLWWLAATGESERMLPADMAQALSQMTGASFGQVVIAVDAPFSGNWLPVTSRPNVTTVAAGNPDELGVALAGGKIAGAVFAHLSAGESLAASMGKASRLADSPGVRAEFLGPRLARRRPLLDDDGDGKGTHAKAFPSAGEGVASLGLYLGAGSTVPAAAPAISSFDPRPRYLYKLAAAPISAGIISAQPVRVQARVRRPDFTVRLSSGALVVDPVSIELSSATGTDLFQGAFNGVDLDGQYDVELSVTDAFGRLLSSTSTINTLLSPLTGGTFKYADGTAVQIPAGALSVDASVEVEAPAADDRHVAGANAKLVSDPTIRLLAGAQFDPAKRLTLRKADDTELTQLGGSIVISLSYPDSDSDGLIDGTDIRDDTLRQFYLDEAKDQWVELPNSFVDKAKKLVGAVTTHFSIHALLSVGNAAADLSDVRVWPVPFVPNDGDPENGVGFAAGNPDSGILFENLPAEVKIAIYNLAGRRVQRFSTTNSGGKVQWDARGDNGRDVASGGYVAVITTPGKKPVTKKLMIAR